MFATIFVFAACGEGVGAPTGQTSSPPSLTESAAPTDPLTGRWTTGEVSCDQQLAALTMAGFTAKEVKASEAGQCRYSTFEIRFLDDQLVVLEDGDVGWDGSYTVVNDQTFTAGDIGNGDYITYRFEIDGDRLTIDMTENTCPFCVDENELRGEMAAQTMIYESAPFERIG